MLHRGRITWLFLVGFVCRCAAAQPLLLTAPESVGMSAERLLGIHAVMQAHVDERRLPGVITLVARRGKVVHFEQFGKRDLERGTPMTADTIFRIYSMTKPITTVAALILLEEGRFQLDDPVAQYIPALEQMQVYAADAADGSQRVALERPVTVRDLLRHTSGMTYGYSTETPVDALYHEAQILDRRGTTLAGMIEKLEKLPLRYQPGALWHYGVSTDVLGYVVEVVSGMPLDRFCAERIFGPLGMVDTGFAVPAASLSRFAGIYTRGENEELVAWGGALETTTYLAPVTFLSGGGGAVSTVPDYLRFLQMLLHGGSVGDVRILDRASVELMTTNQLAGGGEFRPGWGYGFGVQVCVDPSRTQQPGSAGTFGWAGGGNTYFFVDPTEELIGMAWSQLSGPSSISREFKELVYGAIIK